MDSAEDEVLAFVKQYKMSHGGLSPSFDEIADAVGIGKSTVKYHLDSLEQDGKLKVLGIRSIQIPGEVYSVEEP